MPWCANDYRNGWFRVFMYYNIISFLVVYELNMVIICWVIVCCCNINCLIISIIECFSERFMVVLLGGAVFCGTC